MNFIMNILNQNEMIRLGYAIQTLIVLQYTLKLMIDINNDVNNRFDSSGYSKITNRPITAVVNKKILCIVKDKLGHNETIESVNVCAKLYSYLKQSCDGKIKESMQAKSVKKCAKKNK